MRLEIEGCTLVVAYPAPWVFVGKLTGHYPKAMLSAYLNAANKVIVSRGSRTAQLFHEWSEMTTYDTECRHSMTEWTKPHRQGDPPIAQHHGLVRSRLVHMGIATANLFLGGVIKVYSNKSKFEAAIDEAVAKWGK